LRNLKQQQSRVVDELETTNRAENKKEKKSKKRGGGVPKKQNKTKQKEGKLKTYLRIDGLHSERRRKRRRSQAGQPL
jgi:hypothetical protein